MQHTPRRAPQGRAHARELAGLQASVAAAGRKLLEATRANTAALHAVIDLTEGQRAVEAALVARRGAVFDDGLEARRATLAERAALVEGVNQRGAALAALQARITVLRRKDGALHVAG